VLGAGPALIQPGALSLRADHRQGWCRVKEGDCAAAELRAPILLGGEAWARSHSGKWRSGIEQQGPANPGGARPIRSRFSWAGRRSLKSAAVEAPIGEAKPTQRQRPLSWARDCIKMACQLSKLALLSPGSEAAVVRWRLASRQQQRATSPRCCGGFANIDRAAADPAHDSTRRRRTMHQDHRGLGGHCRAGSGPRLFGRWGQSLGGQIGPQRWLPQVVPVVVWDSSRTRVPGVTALLGRHQRADVLCYGGESALAQARP